MSSERGTHEVCDELADGPPDGQDGEQVLVRAGDEVEENRRVDGQVSADAESEDGEERSERDEVGRTACCESKYACEEQGDVERPPVELQFSTIV